MTTTRLDDDGRTAIPAAVLDSLALKPGDEVGFHIEEDGQVVMYRHAPDDEIDEDTGYTIGELRALLAEAEEGPTVSAEEAFARVRAHIAEVARKPNAA